MDTIFFDLETQHTFQELGMFKGKDRDPAKLRISLAGVLYEEDNNETYKFFSEKQTDELLEILKQANLVVGHNVCRFDYKCMQQYYKENIVDLLYEKTFDTLIKLLPYTDDCWTSLDDLAQLNLGMCKPHSGEKIPKMWRDGLHKEVEDYLRNDLKMTKDFYNYAKKDGKVKYTHKDFCRIVGEREVDVKWWCVVCIDFIRTRNEKKRKVKEMEDSQEISEETKSDKNEWKQMLDSGWKSHLIFYDSKMCVLPEDDQKVEIRNKEW